MFTYDSDNNIVYEFSEGDQVVVQCQTSATDVRLFNESGEQTLTCLKGTVTLSA